MQCSHQQCLVAKWLGLSVTVRVRIRAKAREWDFSHLHFNGSCDIDGIRTTVHDVTMIYCILRNSTWRMCLICQVERQPIANIFIKIAFLFGQL